MQDQMLPAEEVVSLFEEMVEAWQDGKDADMSLLEYRNRAQEPESLPQFQNLGALLDYHLQRREYLQGLQQRQDAEATAHAIYEAAAGRLSNVLPLGSHVYYDYQGTREDLRGTIFTIENRDAKIVVIGLRRPRAVAE